MSSMLCRKAPGGQVKVYDTDLIENLSVDNNDRIRTLVQCHVLHHSNHSFECLTSIDVSPYIMSFTCYYLCFFKLISWSGHFKSKQPVALFFNTKLYLVYVLVNKLTIYGNCIIFRFKSASWQLVILAINIKAG